ncbi:MAG: hypothetical protein UT33_C0011G0007 [Candidatus Peregrinibacteria bacterium GW2011_GWC2_39_14]|nr:MAG: hypothetical protein UT33_C0011G0007 [Candidatus Peregrinibacteria bacterium GW2011_GWC2_39_14]
MEDVKLIEWLEFSNQLTDIFPRLKVLDDGRVYEVKELIGKINALKFYIYPQDHNPPHFHVKSKNGDIDVSFRLDNGLYVKGNIKNKADLKRIEYFYEQRRTIMIVKWNDFKK